jgi:hypothetical protein
MMQWLHHGTYVGFAGETQKQKASGYISVEAASAGGRIARLALYMLGL